MNIPPEEPVSALVQANIPHPIAEAVAEMFAAFSASVVVPQGDRSLSGSTTIERVVAECLRKSPGAELSAQTETYCGQQQVKKTDTTCWRRTAMSEARLFTATTFPEIYERILVGPLFRPFAEQLVMRLAPRRGDSAIDVACGTGICARIVRERLGPEAPIVGIDVAPAMLPVARAVDPTIDWREGSATSLPVGPAERFSVLTCHQGLQFMPDKLAAIHEMRRVLTPGGRLGIATWRPLEDSAGMVALNAVAERHVGRIVDSRHSFGDPEGLRSLLTDGGFSDVIVETVAHDVRFPDGAVFARLNAMAVIGMSEKGKAMSEGERGELAGRIAADSEEVIAKATREGMFVLPLSSNIATGRL